MIDRQIRRGLVATSVAALLLGLVPVAAFAFPQSTETSGEMPMNLNGTWLVLNRIEFPKAGPSPSPGAPPTAPAAPGRPFSVGYIFTIDHLPTSEAQKIRDADKAQRQAAIDKATKILAEEQRKKATDPKPLASGEVPIEPKVIPYGIPRNPESVVDEHDDVAVHLIDVDLPKPLQDEIDAANKTETPWEPSDKELATLKSTWKTLKPRAKTEYSKIEWKVMENKYLDGGMLQDERTKDAKFVISGDATLVSSPGQANRNIIIYGANKISDRVIEGGHVRAIMTAAPFPIPIDMKGTFKMFRLTDPPKAATPKKKDK